MAVRWVESVAVMRVVERAETMVEMVAVMMAGRMAVS